MLEMCLVKIENIQQEARLQKKYCQTLVAISDVFILQISINYNMFSYNWKRKSQKKNIFKQFYNDKSMLAN